MRGYYGYRSRYAPIEKNTDPTIPARLAALANNPGLSTKYSEIVASFTINFKKYKGLTTKQYSYLESIEESLTPAKIAEVTAYKAAKKSWEASFAKDPEKVERFKVACQYYAAIGSYFGKIVNGYQSDPTMVPSERTYTKMCMSKYLTQVYDNFKATPKHKPGDLVKLSKSWTFKSNRQMNVASLATRCDAYPQVDRNGFFLVVGVDNHPPISYAAKGTKLYTLVSTDGKSTKFLVEEKHVKAMK